MDDKLKQCPTAAPTLYFAAFGPEPLRDSEVLLTRVSVDLRDRLTRGGTVTSEARLYAHLLVRCLASKHLGHRNSGLRFGRNEWGKPYLEGVHGFHFSISHTENALLVGVAPGELGVDIEALSRRVKLSAARRFFSPGEAAWIAEGGGEASRRFLRLWTRKEALAKALGRGLSGELLAVDVRSAEYAARLQTVEQSGYMCSLCADNADRAAITELTEEEIVAMVSEELSS
jgi:4'-phosphopantetheinyl transferase